MRNFYKFYYALLMYKEQYGDVKVPQKYVMDDYRLGRYVDAVRTAHYKLTDEQRRKLDTIGFVWRVTNKSQDFGEVYRMLIKYVEEHGNCNVPVKYVTTDGVKLGHIVRNIRSGKRELTDNQKKALNELGFQWYIYNSKCDFDTICQLLQEYQKKYGHMHVPIRYIADNHIKLGRLVANIRYGYRKISDEQREKLNLIGFEW